VAKWTAYAVLNGCEVMVNTELPDNVDYWQAVEVFERQYGKVYNVTRDNSQNSQNVYSTNIPLNSSGPELPIVMLFVGIGFFLLVFDLLGLFLN
jgi:hypothetical protein